MLSKSHWINWQVPVVTHSSTRSRHRTAASTEWTAATVGGALSSTTHSRFPVGYGLGGRRKICSTREPIVGLVPICGSTMYDWFVSSVPSALCRLRGYGAISCRRSVSMFHYFQAPQDPLIFVFHIFTFHFLFSLELKFITRSLFPFFPFFPIYFSKSCFTFISNRRTCTYREIVECRHVPVPYPSRIYPEI